MQIAFTVIFDGEGVAMFMGRTLARLGSRTRTTSSSDILTLQKALIKLVRYASMDTESISTKCTQCTKGLC